MRLARPCRPTWRELAHNQADVPLDESIRQAANDVRPERSMAWSRLTGTTAAAKAGSLSVARRITAAG